MRIGFILGEFFNGLRRNLPIALSVVLVTFVSLVFVGAGMLFQAQIDKTKGYWYDKVQVSIFLCTKDSPGTTCPNGEVTIAQRDAIEAQLQSAELKPYVETYEFESREQAFELFQKQYKDSPHLTAGITAASMPESFRVKLVDPEEYQVVSQVFRGRDGVEEVQDQRKLLSQLFGFLGKLTVVAGAIALVMVIAAVLLIATTIRMSAHNRRREVGIMRLVGASNVVIQLPFLLEGIISACVGAALATGCLWLMLTKGGVSWIAGPLKLSYVGPEVLWTITPTIFGIAVVLAGVSSAVALNRYLKV